MRRTPQKAMAVAIFIIIISIINFNRITGSDCIRTIHIVTLLTCGAAIGIFLVNLFMLLRKKD